MLVSLFSVLVFSVLFLVINVRSEECGKSPVVLAEEGKVVNATEGSWPWMVAITRTRGSNRSVICDGFLIDDIHVLSAAHCFDYSMENTTPELWTEQFSALIGSVDQDDTEEYYIQRITKHPDYKKGQYNSDIAIVKLSVRVAFPGFNPVCLQNITTSQLTTDVKVTEVGWNYAKQYSGATGRILEQVSGVQLVPDSHCLEKYKELPYYDDFPRGWFAPYLCAMTPEHILGCVGSGSSLMILNKNRWSAVGLGKFGNHCVPSPYVPYEYTRLTPYLGWIKRHTSMK